MKWEVWISEHLGRYSNLRDLGGSIFRLDPRFDFV